MTLLLAVAIFMFFVVGGATLILTMFGSDPCE